MGPAEAANMMVEVITKDIVEVPFPDTSLLVTQDDTPMDNIYVEKQQRLLTEPLLVRGSAPGAEAIPGAGERGLVLLEWSTTARAGRHAEPGRSARGGPA